jgi:hypothetical protein
MPGEGVKFGAVSADGLKVELFGLGEGFRAAEDPSGDRPGRGRPGGHRPRGGALLAQIGADALVAAFVSERHDLLPQLPGVAAALVPTVVEVGLVLVEDGGPVLPLAGEKFFRPGGVSELSSTLGVSDRR